MPVPVKPRLVDPTEPRALTPHLDQISGRGHCNAQSARCQRCHNLGAQGDVTLRGGALLLFDWWKGSRLYSTLSVAPNPNARVRKFDKKTKTRVP